MSRHYHQPYAIRSLLLLGILLGGALSAADGDVAVRTDTARAVEDASATGSAVVAGPAVVARRDHKAYGHALPGITTEEFVRMIAGKRVFSRTWLPAGEGPAELQGLGPLYNAASCAECHFRDGRGAHGGTPAPLIFRLLHREERSGAHTIEESASGVAAAWGGQLQDHAVTGAPEGRVEITWQTIEGRYADGTTYTLREPGYALAGVEIEAGRAPEFGPRIPPTLVGIGLLEAVAEETILAWADPLDADRDGISGRPHDVVHGGEALAGRFGWKAEQPDLAAQVAGALAEDMGIVSAFTANAGGVPEITGQHFAALLDYLHLLGPPAPRTDHPLYARGRTIFERIGCGGCHRTSLTTRCVDQVGPRAVPAALLCRSITPYTDLLLHDLGKGLADGEGRTEFDREWRTPPLWGLGLMDVVNGQLRLLHDGRAHSFEEAVLWHGGEALSARERFEALAREERDALVAFLRSI